MERTDFRDPWTYRWMLRMDDQRQRGRRIGTGPGGQLTLKEWRQVRAEERRIDRDAQPLELAPPEAFRGTAALGEREVEKLTRSGREVGRSSGTVTTRVSRSTAGWAKGPSAAEFYDAVRAAGPNRRQYCLISMWVKEATDLELVTAEHEYAYTPRLLATAMHRIGMTYGAEACRMNEWTR